MICLNYFIFIYQRLKIYPNHPQNIRETEMGLKLIKQNIKILIEDLIKKKKMENYIWKLYDIKINNLDLLTEKILIEIFGNNFMEPFEDLDKRIKLISNKKNDFDKIIELIKGKNLTFDEKIPLVVKERINKYPSPIMVSFNDIFVEKYSLEKKILINQSLLIDLSYNQDEEIKKLKENKKIQK